MKSKQIKSKKEKNNLCQEIEMQVIFRIPFQADFKKAIYTSEDDAKTRQLKPEGKRTILALDRGAFVTAFSWGYGDQILHKT